MKVSDLVKLTNEKLDGERLTEAQLINHMDNVIFDINEALSAVYPTFSEAKLLPGYDGTYSLIPDNYLRNLVPVGAALKYYQAEEEGESIARTYQETYGMYLFVIKRDYIQQVPEIFRALGAGVLDISKWTQGSSTLSKASAVFPTISSTELTVINSRISALTASLAALQDSLIIVQEALQQKASDPHTHPNLADADHNHDSDYSAIGHTHPNLADADHNHDSDYSAIGHTHLASSLAIVDAGNFFTAANIEGALQEVGNTLNGVQEALDALLGV